MVPGPLDGIALLATLPVVNVRDSTLRKAALVDEFQPHHPLCLGKNRKAAPENHRMDQEPIVIDDIELDQTLRERRTAVSHDVFAVLALQLRDFLENFDVFDFALSDEQLAAIDGLDTGVRRGPDPDRITLETYGKVIPEAWSAPTTPERSSSQQ
jgi:hypothetical protein